MLRVGGWEEVFGAHCKSRGAAVHCCHRAWWLWSISAPGCFLLAHESLSEIKNWGTDSRLGELYVSKDGQAIQQSKLMRALLTFGMAGMVERH